MDLSAPGVVCGAFQFGAFVSLFQEQPCDRRPIAVKIVNFEGDHLVFLPLWDVYVLEKEVGMPESETCEPPTLPTLLEAQLLKESK